MKKRAILSWILLVCGFICVYNSIGISELLFSSNQVAQNIVSVMLVVLGVFLSGISLTFSKNTSQENNEKKCWMKKWLSRLANIFLCLLVVFVFLKVPVQIVLLVCVIGCALDLVCLFID